MLRGTRHNRSTRPDPTREPELFPADETPATTSSSPLSSPVGPDGAPNTEAPLTPGRNTLSDGPISSDDAPETAQTESHTPPTDPMLADDLVPLFARLSRSAFRSRFRLRTPERSYIERIGFPTLRRHAEEFVRTRLAPALPPNDGRQTPMRGHPVFIAQHATGCCCRGCLSKWHGIPAGRPLTDAEQHYIVRVLLTWIMRQLGR